MKDDNGSEHGSDDTAGRRHNIITTARDIHFLIKRLR